MTEQTTRLAVGQVWRTREGREVTIDAYDPEDTEYPFTAGDDWYAADGRFTLLPETHPEDLIELINPTPQPMSPEIPEPIRTGAAPFYVLVASRDRSDGGGNPIVWETIIPEGCTLQGALQQQRRVGSRYGTTYIAECRIISELTKNHEANES